MENCKNKLCVETKQVMGVFGAMAESAKRAAAAGKAMAEVFLQAEDLSRRLRNRRKRGKR